MSANRLGAHAPTGRAGDVQAPAACGEHRADVDDLAALLRTSRASNAEAPRPHPAPITTLDVDGVAVHHRDSGERGDGDTYVLVHGLGGSLANWEPLWPHLSERGRILTPDLAGFGRTPGDGRSAVADNVDLLARYLERLTVGPVVLVGNSMGGMIAALLAARRPDLVERLVLIDPVLPLHPADRPHPMVLATFGLYLVPPAARFVIPRYARRRGLERLGGDGVLGVVADPRRVPGWVVRRAVEETKALAEVQDAVPSLVRAAQSIVVAAAGRSYRRALTGLTVPVTLVHGTRDHLVPVSGARRAARAHPHWRYVEGADLGHVPMFEAAAWVAGVTVS